MSVNASTYPSDSSLQPYTSSTISFSPLELYCLVPRPGCFIFNAYTLLNILLILPLSVLILRHGCQRKQRSSSSAAGTTPTHSDSFTHHLVVMELINVLGCVLCCFGIYMGQFQLLIVWCYLFCVSLYGEGIFHILTCLEHYLAVVHPIIYLSLRKEKWIRTRNVVVGCIWPIACGLTCLFLTKNIYLVLFSCLSVSSVILISFCSLSVLYVLIHPGPGDQGKDRVRVHQSKRRAFYTILAILGVLMLRCIYILVWALQAFFNGPISNCVLSLIAVWFYFPGSLVLPLLYLQKTGMLACGSKNRK